MDDTRDKPLDRTCHADPLSYVAAGTDENDPIDHMAPYAEDAVFKGAIGPVHANAMNKLNGFWVSK